MQPLFEALDFIDDCEPHDAPVNMAIDEALLLRLAAPVVRIYRWLRPAVSFGYFEKFDAVRQLHHERELVRRWTGGGVVLHGDDLTYSLLVPPGARFMEMKTADSYRAIHECLVRALNAAGLEVSLAGGAAASSNACFQSPVEHDVLRQGRKVAGAAQRRTRFGLLHQGSIQNIALPRDFPSSFAAAIAPNVARKTLDASRLDAAEKIAAAKYATAAWMRKY